MRDHPDTIVVNIANVCNYSCPQCPYEPPLSARFMARSVFSRVADEAAAIGATRIRFLGLSEPTLHPDLGAFIVRARDLGLETHVISNGSFATHPTRRSQLADNLPTELEVSLDAFTASTYERVRGRTPRQFLELSEAVAAFFAEIAGGSCRRTVSFVLHPTLEAESDVFTRYWAQRADRVRMRAAHTFSDQIVGPLGRPQAEAPAGCAFIQSRIFVDVDGQISACNLDIDGVLVLGACVGSDSLSRAWRSGRRKSLVQSFEDGELDQQCRRCSRCAGLA